MANFGKMPSDENIFAGTPFSNVAETLLKWNARMKKNPSDVMFARIPYAIEIK